MGKQYNESQNRFRVLDNLDTTANRLLDLAIVEAKRSLSSTNEEIHPIYFGASALEYGCTLDAVTQLVPRLQDKSQALILLVQADQYGIAHSPFAPARAYLSEHGCENCRVPVHDTKLASSEDDTNDMHQLDKWELKEVLVSDLTPTPPAWTSTQ